MTPFFVTILAVSWFLTVYIQTVGVSLSPYIIYIYHVPIYYIVYDMYNELYTNI